MLSGNSFYQILAALLAAFVFLLPDAFAIQRVSENCQPDPNYGGGSGVVRSYTTGTLRSGDSRPGNLVTQTVQLERVDSYYICKNTELSGAGGIVDCGQNNENIRGAIVQKNCVAELVVGGQRICVQDLYKWVDEPRKQEVVVNLDPEGEAADQFCGKWKEVCNSQWGGYCLEGQYTKRCNLPLDTCNVFVDDAAGETCAYQGWECSHWATEDPSNICMDLKYNYSCKVGEDVCERWVTKNSCTGLTIPDFNYGDDPDRDNGFGDAVKAAQVVQAIKNEFGVGFDGKIRLFTGEKMGCAKQYIPYYCNCCGKDAEKQYKCDFGNLGDCLAQTLCSCTPGEMQLWVANQKGVATMVVSNDWAMLEPDRLLYGDKYSRFGSVQGFFGCPDWILDRRRNYFCRWNSKIARVIQEQGRIQLRERAGKTVSYNKGTVSFSRYKAPGSAGSDVGSWLHIGNLWGRNYWVWQYPSSCASGHGSPLECPIDNSVYVISCIPEKGCSPSWQPTQSPMQKRRYKAEKATLVGMQANAGTYTAVDALTFAKADCSGASCMIRWHGFSSLTPISSIGWAYEYLFYPSKWNSGINISDVWIEPISFGSDYKPLQDSPFTKIRFSTKGTPNPDNPSDYTEVYLNIGADGELSAENPAYSSAEGISLPNGVRAFGSCSLKQGKCELYAWSPKGVSRKPFFLGGGYEKVSFLFAKLTNYCKYELSYDCSGFSLDEFTMLDLDQMDFSNILGEMYTPITPDLQLNMKNKVQSKSSRAGSSMGGTVRTDASGKPIEYTPPEGASTIGNGVAPNGAALIVSKPYCSKPSCSVTATFLRYLQDQYKGMPNSPAEGKCYPLSISVDWGDGTSQTVPNPASTYADPKQCEAAQETEPYANASHTYDAPGIYEVKATYTDPFKGGRYSAKVIVHVDDPMNPDPYNKGVAEGALVKEN